QINIFDLDCLDQFHQGLKKKYTPVDLIPRIESNLKILEQISAEIFRLVSAKINGTPPDMKVDPYRMDIEDNKNEILEKSKGQHALGVDESIKADLARVWLSPKKTISNEYA
ncbi:MAG: hypothetical protein ACI8X3_003431, partial [Saprospiraceae bacterium]